MIAETSQLIVGYTLDTRGTGGSRDSRDTGDSRVTGDSKGGKSGE